MSSDPHYFVLAPSFHGATLLAFLLNNHPDIVAPGDTNPPRTGTDCSCGRSVAECPFWMAVTQSVSPQEFSARKKLLPTVPALTGNASYDAKLTAAVSIAAIHSSARLWRLAGRQVDEYVLAWEAFKDAAIQASGARIMVDGEKSASKFLAFRSIGNLDARVIHLTRDPRAFVHSWIKHSREQGHSVTPADAAALWIMRHKNILRASRGLADDRYLLVRYEDLAERPAATLKRLFGFMGVANHDVSRPPENAHLIGNRMLKDFSGVITPDATWKEALSHADQERISILTEPLISRFGYRLA